MISHKNYAMMLSAFVRMLVALYHGTAQITMRKFDLKTLLRHIQDYKLTSVAVVPPMALMMADSPLLDDYDLSSLRFIACGAAPLGAAIVHRLLKRLPGAILRQGYGMTELSVVSHIASLDTPEGSVGKLMPGTRMKVIAEDGRLCGPFESGEMWISGPQVMLGYWKKIRTDKANL
ncbi:hypothetical protein COOONC_12792 [Cooperia oncophora]